MMNERIEEQEIEQLLSNVKPEPGAAFYNRMANVPWAQSDKRKELILSKRITSIAAVLALLLIVFVTVPPFKTFAHDIYNSLFNPIPDIDRFLSNLEFSGSVLVVKDDDIILNEGYGLANREWNIPNSPDTKFRIGPLTMQFTGMAILMLQEQGLLSVNDPICEYIEECPSAWQDITLHHLLTHTSGIPDYMNFDDFNIKVRTPLIDLFIDKPLDFTPGTDWHLSYSGYILLGHVISEVSGSSYVTFLRRNIFEPLNMSNTDVDRHTTIIGNRAEGHAGLLPRAEYIDISNLYSAAGMYSTTEDILTWTRALLNGEVVSKDSWDAMWDAAYVDDDTVYAYGFAQETVRDQAFIVAGGTITGFISSVRFYAEDDIIIIILANMQIDTIGGVSSNIHNWLTE